MDRQAGPGNVHVANETTSTIVRTTKSGKQFRYDLRIIQQPERARACGAGAKGMSETASGPLPHRTLTHVTASADRRPVDPPPILQLQIAELLPTGVEQDVTFTMHATYFLYATLERGRTVAQPRNAQDNKSIDVLTGSAVAGMQPFDRPAPAIYFIFPDLSVRHEGRYRLLFSLFEFVGRTEDEDHNASVSPMPNERCFVHRMEVRSTLFDVFSAKRFPGLTESTNLSRTFAEQGSRIRIRRDVRMRRRDNKSGKDWDDYDDDTSQMPRLSQTPDPYSAHTQMQQPRQAIESMHRPRSANGQQNHMMQNAARRTSMNDLSQQYHHAQVQQQQQQSSAFAFPNPYNQTQSYTQASALHPPPSHHISGANYQSAGLMPSATQQSNYYSYGTTPQAMSQMSYPTISTSFDATVYQPARNSGDFSAVSADSRRTSMQSLVPQNQQLYTPQSATGMSTFPRQQQQQQPHQHHGSIDSLRGLAAAPPPEPVQPPTRVTTPNPPALNTKPSFGTTLPPLATSFTNKLEAASPSTAVAGSQFVNALPTPTDSHKRAYGSTFSTAWQNSSNKQGARPNEPASMFLAADADADDTADIGDAAYMRVYRRAGGHTVQRQMP